MSSPHSKPFFTRVARSINTHRYFLLGLPVVLGLPFFGPVPMFAAGGAALLACGLQALVETRPVGTQGGPATIPYVTYLMLGLAFSGYSVDKIRAVENVNERAVVAAQRRVAETLALYPQTGEITGAYQVQTTWLWRGKPQTKIFRATLDGASDAVVRITVHQDGRPSVPRTFARPNGAEQLRS